MERIKVTAVNYLNTKPFLYGILQSPISKSMELKLDMPSECARKLATGEADLGLVPVAIIPQLERARLVSDYCIGTIGAVGTVSIFSHRPLHEIEYLYLDYQSRTSVELVKILLEKHWHLHPRLLPSGPGFEEQVAGNTAALIIGDRAIGLDEKFPFVYDLGSAWLEFTGLPFVFAAWVSNFPLEETFLGQFNEALQLGLDLIPDLMYLLPSPHPGFDLQRYYRENISYTFDQDKKKALELFLSHLQASEMVGIAAQFRTTEQAG
jgi:chorismate dehydratase